MYDMEKYFSKVLIAVFSVIVFPAGLEAQEVKLTVSNPSNLQRQEVVEADLKSVCQHLGADSDAPLVVKNALGQEIT